MNTIYLDFDNTVAESNKRIIELVNEKYNINKQEDDLKDYEYQSIYPISKMEILDFYKSDDFFQGLEFKKGALEFIDKYKKEYKIIIATRGTDENLLKKHEWIKKNIGEDISFIGMDGTEFSKKDIDMQNAIHIDDEIGCFNTNADLKILYTDGKDFPWHKGNPDDGIIISNTWKEVEEILDFFKKYNYKNLTRK